MKFVTHFDTRKKRSTTAAKSPTNSPRDNTVRSGKKSKADVVKFPNSTAYNLHKMEREIARTPVINSKRRDEMRNAILNGHYIANPGKIASKLIDMELGLFKKK